jgi:hypothetical protein
VRHDKPKLELYTDVGKQLSGAVRPATDLEGLRIVLTTALGDRYRVRVSDDGSVVGLWLPTVVSSASATMAPSKGRPGHGIQEGRRGRMNNRQLIERYTKAHADQDWATVSELTASDLVVTYPQSGETFRGRDNYVRMLADYPGHLESDADLTITTVRARRESVHVMTSPIAAPTITVTEAGDDFIIEGVIKYPDGGIYNIVGIIELGGGLVVRETWYFAAPFEPPAWRAPYREG